MICICIYREGSIIVYFEITMIQQVLSTEIEDVLKRAVNESDDSSSLSDVFPNSVEVAKNG